MTGADGPGKPDVDRILLGGGSRILVLDGKTGQPLKIIPIQDVANHVFAGPAGTIYWIGLPNCPNRSPVMPPVPRLFGPSRPPVVGWNLSPCQPIPSGSDRSV